MDRPPTATGGLDPRRERAWIAAAPVLFVLLWSTGFIGAKLGLPHAEPFTFLLWRFVIVTALMAAVSVATRAPWPDTWAQAGRIAVTGLLVQGTYLGGIFASIHAGLPAAVAALIGGLQPLLTAIAAGPFLGERVTGRQWAGLVLGLGGVTLVLGDRITLEGTGLAGIAFAFVALFGITAGTLYQKRHGEGMDLRTGSVIQFAACIVPAAVLAVWLETMEVAWTGEFVFALAWLVLALSLGAISLLMLLIRRGAAAKVASLFYLVPPVTAVLAYFIFGETLSVVALGGMAVAVVGVALVTRT